MQENGWEKVVKSGNTIGNAAKEIKTRTSTTRGTDLDVGEDGGDRVSEIVAGDVGVVVVRPAAELGGNAAEAVQRRLHLALGPHLSKNCGQVE